MLDFPGWRTWGSLSVTTGASCPMGTFPNSLPSPRRGWHIALSAEGGLCTQCNRGKSPYQPLLQLLPPLGNRSAIQKGKRRLERKRERERQKKRNGELNRRKGRKKEREETRAIPGEVGGAENERQEPREGEQRQRVGERKTQALKKECSSVNAACRRERST